MSVDLTWIGQAGFLIEGADTRILIDPFFSDYPGRNYAAPSPAPYLDGLSWFFATHEHLDHLDSALFPELKERAPDVRLVVPAPLVQDLLRAGFDSSAVLGASPGAVLPLGGGAYVRVLPAYHALSVGDPFGDGDTGSGARFLGYAFDLGDLVIYHSGDTVLTPELRAATRGLNPDFALLPINGRDFYREELDLVGNMDAREAVQFAIELEAQTLIPMHWDMFSANSVRVASVLEEVERIQADLHVVVPARFRKISLA